MFQNMKQGWFFCCELLSFSLLSRFYTFPRLSKHIYLGTICPYERPQRFITFTLFLDSRLD